MPTAGADHSAYAEDVNVNVCSSIYPDTADQAATLTAVKNMYDWYIVNGMLPNPSKSEAILIGTNTQLSKFESPFSVDVAGSSIQCKDSITSLGVVIDSGLSFDHRVSSIVSSCSYHLKALAHIRPVLNDKTAETIGRAIILSRLDYCNSLLNGVTKTNLDRLQRLQNRLVRAVTKLPYRSHITAARNKLHWLTVRERISFKLAVLTYTTRATHVPQYLAELLVDRPITRTLRSSADTSVLVTPRTRTKRATCAFSSAAPRIWNPLPISIRECKTLPTFKTNLKTFLFKRS